MHANLTIRDILNRLPGYRLHQIKYAIDQYNIEPRARCGIVRLWAEEDIPTIKRALQRVSERAGGRL